MKRAIYAGSFDPVTKGHLNLIRRAAGLFDELIVAVLCNKAKTPLFSAEERVSMIEAEISDLDNVCVESFEGMLVDYARKKDARILVRGIRSGADLDFELQMAQANRALCPSIDTVFLVSEPKDSFINSSTAREVASFGGDVSAFVTPAVAGALRKHFEGK